MRMSRPYFVGAEVMMHKIVDEKDGKVEWVVDDVKLEKIGPKPQKAQRWLQSFKPNTTPDGQTIQRVVFRMPIGYRERKDVIQQFKKEGFTYERARFEMLSRHAGPDNTLVYLDPKLAKARSEANQSIIEQPRPDKPALITPVRNALVDAHGYSIQTSERETENV